MALDPIYGGGGGLPLAYGSIAAATSDTLRPAYGDVGASGLLPAYGLSDVGDQPEPGGVEISDDFDRADQNGLGDSAEGWSWEALNTPSDVGISNNQASHIGASQNFKWWRADIDLSSADQFTQYEITSATATNINFDIMCRWAPDANTCYRGIYRQSSSNTFRLYRTVDGTSTLLGAILNTTPLALPFVFRIQAVGDQITLWADDVLIMTRTDTNITANVRTGFGFSVGSTTGSTINNFEAGVVAT